MTGRDVALASARNFRAFRARGVTVRKTIDMLIATFCMERRHLLLHSDRDFDPITEHLGPCDRRPRSGLSELEPD